MYQAVDSDLLIWYLVIRLSRKKSFKMKVTQIDINGSFLRPFASVGGYYSLHNQQDERGINENGRSKQNKLKKQHS